jgi:hypothetical protein
MPLRKLLIDRSLRLFLGVGVVFSLTLPKTFFADAESLFVSITAFLAERGCTYGVAALQAR